MKNPLGKTRGFSILDGNLSDRVLGVDAEGGTCCDPHGCRMALSRFDRTVHVPAAIAKIRS